MPGVTENRYGIQTSFVPYSGQIFSDYFSKLVQENERVSWQLSVMPITPNFTNHDKHTFYFIQNMHQPEDNPPKKETQIFCISLV